STPASKYSRCIWRMSSGRSSTRCSLHPSSASPPKSSGPSCCPWTHVPNAPSKTSTRSRMVARNSDIARQVIGDGSRSRRSFDPRSSHRGAVAREAVLPRDPHRPVGARPELAVARAVAVGPHVCGLVAEPGVESTRLLCTAHVGAHEVAGELAVGSDLELGGQHRVEAESLGDRTHVHPERRRY